MAAGEAAQGCSRLHIHPKERRRGVCDRERAEIFPAGPGRARRDGAAGVARVVRVVRVVHVVPLGIGEP